MAQKFRSKKKNRIKTINYRNSYYGILYSLHNLQKLFNTFVNVSK